VGPKTLNERLTLAGIYSPYFIFPLWLTLTLAFNPQPFGTAQKTKKN
jgi:hypothetical protein